jgi:hypothetical protein
MEALYWKMYTTKVVDGVEFVININEMIDLRFCN